MDTCDGNGFCLRQTDNDLNEYEKAYECKYNCVPIQCPNYKLCGKLVPQCILNCHDGRCMICNIVFGNPNLSIREADNEECPVCLKETKEMVKAQGCRHEFCIDCFRKIYYDGSDDSEDEKVNEYEGKCPLCRNRHKPYWRNKN